MPGDPRNPQIPEAGMVLAAGFGKRMRPITDKTPKPLLTVQGESLLDRAIDRLEAVGVKRIVVNAHHLAHKVEAHLNARPTPPAVIVETPDILETGGGVKNALDRLGPGPFYAINGDVLWLDGVIPALARLAAFFDPARMDGVLLLHPTVSALGYDGPGDFRLDTAGRVSRRQERDIAPYLFAGIQILTPNLFADTPDGAFSLNLIYDRAIAERRLFGLPHDGEWYHVGTPVALTETRALFDRRFPRRPARPGERQAP